MLSTILHGGNSKGVAVAVNSQSFAWGAVSALCPSTERQEHNVKMKGETKGHQIQRTPSSQCQYSISALFLEAAAYFDFSQITL